MELKPTKYKDLVKNLRAKVISLSGLNASRVYNATSVRGPDLFKAISETEVSSYDSISDVFIVFEVLIDNDYDQFATKEKEENTGTTYGTIIPYKFNMKIYGNACYTVAQKLLYGFKISEELLELRELKGIHVTGVEPMTSINEFINNTVWMRCDLSIKFQARSEFKIGNDSADLISTDFTIRNI